MLLSVLAVWAAFLLQNLSLERQAYQAYRARDWATAARLYEAHHSSGAGTASTYDNLGMALTNLGQWNQAETALRKAIQLNPQHRWAYNHLGFVYREQGRYEQAIGMFQRQIRISPTDPYAYRNLAATLVLLDRLEEADQVAAAHEKYTYERGSVYIDMACNLNARNHPEQALTYLKKAEAIGADRALLAQESAHYFLTVRDYRRAEQQYLKLLEYQPYEPMVALRMGTLYWDTGNLEKAATAFARVIQVDENDRVTIRTSANTSKTIELSELRRTPAAGRAVLGDAPVDWAKAAILLRLRRKVDQPAASFHESARELLTHPNPPAAEAWLRDALGWSLFQDGKTAEAIEELQRAYTLFPGRRLTAYHLAVALEQSAEPQKALPLYARSLEPLAETTIECGCEEPDAAAREKIARALYIKLKGAPAGFESYVSDQNRERPSESPRPRPRE